MKKLVVGNWKMNPSSLEEAKNIIRKTKSTVLDLSYTEAVVCPPFVYISGIKPAANFHIGAQNVYFEKEGAHTGEVSTSMLWDIGVEYVIIGHSEERMRGDSDDIVSKKVSAVLSAGMIPILCIGEKLRDEAGTHFDYIKEQMKNSLAGVPSNKSKSIVIAYEPIWAIGAKDAMSPEGIYEMSLFVKKVFADIFGADIALKVAVLYGGAVNAENAGDIISIGKVDGLLVGRESVSLDGFPALLKAVDGAKK